MRQLLLGLGIKGLGLRAQEAFFFLFGSRVEGLGFLTSKVGQITRAALLAVGLFSVLLLFYLFTVIVLGTGCG